MFACGYMGFITGKKLHYSRHDYAIMGVILVVSYAFTIISRPNNLALLTIFMLTNIAEFTYLVGKLQRAKK